MTQRHPDIMLQCMGHCGIEQTLHTYDPIQSAYVCVHCRVANAQLVDSTVGLRNPAPAMDHSPASVADTSSMTPQQWLQFSTSGPLSPPVGYDTAGWTMEDWRQLAASVVP